MGSHRLQAAGCGDDPVSRRSVSSALSVACPGSLLLGFPLRALRCIILSLESPDSWSSNISKAAELCLEFT